MKKIKIFENDRYSMQNEIDAWLNNNPEFNIIQISSSDSSSQYGSRSPTLYVLYEERTTEADLLKS